MNDRLRRLQRLEDFQRKQHESTVTALRMAQGSLHAAERAVHGARANDAAAHAVCCRALAGSDTEGWLLGCAEAELARSAILRGISSVGRANAIVEASRKHETEARTRHRQMEILRQGVQAQQRKLADRVEQSRLEETARLMRSSAPAPDEDQEMLISWGRRLGR